MATRTEARREIASQTYNSEFFLSRRWLPKAHNGRVNYPPEEDRAMLTIYARTFMIATMTDGREARQGGAETRPEFRGGRGWLGSAWRRISGQAA
jgi:hypothetical protein